MLVRSGDRRRLSVEPSVAPIIDCHCHAGVGDGFTGPWNTAAPLDKYLRRAGRAGIARTVIFAPFHTDYRVANRAVGRLVVAGAGRFIGFAFVHCDRDRGRIRELVAEGVERFGFRGIKVHRHDANISREVCEVARAFAIPILYDVVGDVSVLELLATEFPDVAFIVPHLGSFADDWSAQLALIDHLVRHPNVYADTSGVRRFDLLVAAVKRAGARKILFGSDGPWLHPALELAKVRALGLTASDEALVLGGNLLRILRERTDASSVISHAGRSRFARPHRAATETLTGVASGKTDSASVGSACSSCAAPVFLVSANQRRGPS